MFIHNLMSIQQYLVFLQPAPHELNTRHFILFCPDDTHLHK
jgi:hypothetical protein